MAKFYLCEHCKNLIGMVDNKGVPIMCCGSKMKALEPNTTDAAGEKHLPVIEVNGNEIKVKVGSVSHPMSEEHYIEWIYLETKNGGQRKNLSPTSAPEVTFSVVDDEAVSVYAYCNLHGLWKTEL